ncbi:hypothetical protein GOODEAATRI_027297 [Goodea atripinnis]|uniref:Uncharacterized protein n=1 Tax=Goodea atripinnis TaxID=208336 RepID=A0ABV0P893_9TELE
MVAFVDPSHFLSDLYPPFSSLCSDPEVSVRRSVAASFHQIEMTDELISSFVMYCGRSYWNRLRFLDVCEIATEIFSRKYFNKHFLIPALELVHDPVANVR